VQRPPPEVLAQTPLWTDDYSDLLGAMRPLGAHLPWLRGGSEPTATAGLERVPRTP
jgi:hypothetical protein